MNSKLAKSLRKMSRTMAQSGKITVERELIEDVKKQKITVKLRTDGDGKNMVDKEGMPLYDIHKIADGQKSNNHLTVRGIYRNLKRQVLEKNPYYTPTERPA